MNDKIIAGLLALARETGGRPGEARVKAAMVAIQPPTLGDQQAWAAIHSLLCQFADGDYAREDETPLGGAVRTISEWHAQAQRTKDADDAIHHILRLASDAERQPFTNDQHAWRQRDAISNIRQAAAGYRVGLEPAPADAAFKNFHRNLCKRFDYFHDDVHWRRDLASLEEHIAKGTGAAAQAAMRTLQNLGYTYDGGEQWKPPLGRHASRDYVSCPICGEPHMQRDLDADGNALIFCTNHECRSNGGAYYQVGTTVTRADFDTQAAELKRARTVIEAIHMMTVRALGSGKHAMLEQIRQECRDYQVGKSTPARAPLTRDQIAEAIGTVEYGPRELAAFRAIEAAHGIHGGDLPERPSARDKFHLPNGEMRDALIEAGWTPPECGKVPAFDHDAAREAYNNRYHKVAAGMPLDCWLIAWKAGLDWAAGVKPPAVYRGEAGNLHVVGTGDTSDQLDRMLREMELLTWRTKDDIGHTCTVGWATEQLKRLYDEWPGGLDEVEAVMRTLHDANARVGDFERLLEGIGVVRDAGQLLLQVRSDAYMVPIAEFRPDSAAAKIIAAWMMRKQELLHGGAEPGQVEGAVALMTAPAEEPFHHRVPVEHIEVTVAVEPAWTDWDGSALRDANGRQTGWPTCPVHPIATIRVRFRDGEERQVEEPQLIRWAWTRPYVSDADIVAYQIIDDGIPF